jgi:hypothetical protein
MSCEVMSANQLRLWFSSFAYLLLIDLRATGFKREPYLCQSLAADHSSSSAKNRGRSDRVCAAGSGALE